MSEEVWCRLCLNICNDYRSLYDETGHCNAELYDVTVKYFHPMILSTIEGNTHTVMCLKCWRHIWKFHSFQNDILLAQEQLSTTRKPIEVYVKEEHPPLDITDVLTDAIETQTNNDIDVKNELLSIGGSDVDLMDTNHDMSDTSNSNAELLVPKSEVTTEDEVRGYEIFSLDDNTQAGNRTEQDTSQFPIEDNAYQNGMFAGESINLCMSNSYSNAVELSSDDENWSVPVSGDPSDENTQKATSMANDFCIAKWLPTLNCPLCDVAFLNYGLLYQHFKEYHPSERPHVQCCQKRFYTRYLLAEHVCLHVDPNRFRCKVCGVTYSSKTALRQHMIRQHPKSKAALNYAPRSDKKIDDIVAKWKPNLECALCKKSYPLVTQLHGHFRLQHRNEAFYILCCKRKFMLLTDIREHALYHTAKEASNPQTLAENTKTMNPASHDDLCSGPKLSGDKGATADSPCRAATTTTNTRVGPAYHKCNVCRKTFRNFNKLQLHMTTHTESGHIKCKYCCQAFKTSAGVYTHLIKKHPDKNPCA